LNLNIFMVVIGKDVRCGRIFSDFIAYLLLNVCICELFSYQYLAKLRNLLACFFIHHVYESMIASERTSDQNCTLLLLSLVHHVAFML